MPAGDVGRFELGDDQSGKRPLGRSAERFRFARDLPAQFRGTVADFAMDQPLVFVNANLPGNAHQIPAGQYLIAQRRRATPTPMRTHYTGKPLVKNSVYYDCIVCGILPIKMTDVGLGDGDPPNWPNPLRDKHLEQLQTAA